MSVHWIATRSRTQNISETQKGEHISGFMESLIIACMSIYTEMNHTRNYHPSPNQVPRSRTRLPSAGLQCHVLVPSKVIHRYY
jgi:hypothetical protein